MARYYIPRIPHAPVPLGKRFDIRKPKRLRGGGFSIGHILSPTRKMVEDYFACPSREIWHAYEKEYLSMLSERFRARQAEFDDLAELAKTDDVFVGCSCPTVKNPDVYRCHTVLALRFMRTKYQWLDVRFPAPMTLDESP